jgi:hypothetical protein
MSFTELLDICPGLIFVDCRNESDNLSMFINTFLDDIIDDGSFAGFLFST